MAREAIVRHREAIADLEDQTGTIGLISEAIVKALQNGGKVITYGNGGSAADAQHLAAELVGRFSIDRPALPAIALTTNTSILTAIANDYSYDQVFTRQIEAIAGKGDVAVALSTSGRSRNVLSATKRAKELGLVTVGLTSKNGGELARLADYCLLAGSDTAHVQEATITAIHIVCSIVEGAIFGTSKGLERA